LHSNILMKKKTTYYYRVLVNLMKSKTEETLPLDKHHLK